MSSLEPNGTLSYRVGRVEDRVTALEKHEPAVLTERVNNLLVDVRALKRAFYVFSFSVVGSAIMFAFTVFALLGKH